MVFLFDVSPLGILSLEELRGDRELVLGCVQKVRIFIGQK